MKEQLVITAVGPDRPGLVDELTGYLLEAGANVADSRMVNLRGRFAMLILAEADDSAAEQIVIDVIEAGNRIGLKVTVAPRELVPVEPSDGMAFELTAKGLDKPGIVHRITRLLAAHRVNIEDMDTTLEQKRYGSTPVFSLQLMMVVPPDVSIDLIRRELTVLCNELNVDFGLEPA